MFIIDRITSVLLPPLVLPSSTAAVASSRAAPFVACTPLDPSSLLPFPLRPFLLPPCPPSSHTLLDTAIAPHPRKLGPHPFMLDSTIQIASNEATNQSCYPGGSLVTNYYSSIVAGIRLGLDHSCNHFSQHIVDCTTKVVVAIASERAVGLALEPFCDRRFWAFSFSQIL